MILALGARGPEFNSRTSPLLSNNLNKLNIGLSRPSSSGHLMARLSMLMVACLTVYCLTKPVYTFVLNIWNESLNNGIHLDLKIKVYVPCIKGSFVYWNDFRFEYARFRVQFPNVPFLSNNLNKINIDKI